MKNEKRNINDELLARWLNGNLTNDERQELEEWSKADDDHSKTLKDMQRIEDDIELLKQMEAVDSKSALHKVKSRMVHASSGLTAFFKHWQRVAAVILIPLLAYNMYQIVSNQTRTPELAAITWNEISTPPGLRSEFQLPDGSTVWLNANTRLKYPLNFAKDQRLVELEGEALFDVKSNPQRPFVVDAGAIQVEAIGTTFNVMAYRDAEQIQTALIEGKVNLYSKHGNELEQRATLLPGQLGVYHAASKHLQCKDENLDKYIAWREGTLLFRNDSMEDVLAKIGRWYNVNFELMDEIDERYAYTGEFSGEPLSQVLEYIELTTPVKFTESKTGSAEMNTNAKRIIYVSNKK
jgi:ferric-dicitrate binding protein FerR (iron transport regulator)